MRLSSGQKMFCLELLGNHHHRKLTQLGRMFFVYSYFGWCSLEVWYNGWCSNSHLRLSCTIKYGSHKLGSEWKDRYSLMTMWGYYFDTLPFSSRPPLSEIEELLSEIFECYYFLLFVAEPHLFWYIWHKLSVASGFQSPLLLHCHTCSLSLLWRYWHSTNTSQMP